MEHQFTSTLEQVNKLEEDWRVIAKNYNINLVIPKNLKEAQKYELAKNNATISKLPEKITVQRNMETNMPTWQLRATEEEGEVWDHKNKSLQKWKNWKNREQKSINAEDLVAIFSYNNWLNSLGMMRQTLIDDVFKGKRMWAWIKIHQPERSYVTKKLDLNSSSN